MDNLSITLTLALSVSQSDKHKMKPQTSLFSGPLHIYMRRFICPAKKKKLFRRGIRINKHTRRTPAARTEKKQNETKVGGILTASHCCNSNDMKSSYQFHVISLTARINQRCCWWLTVCNAYNARISSYWQYESDSTVIHIKIDSIKSTSSVAAEFYFINSAPKIDRKIY